MAGTRSRIDAGKLNGAEPNGSSAIWSGVVVVVVTGNVVGVVVALLLVIEIGGVVPFEFDPPQLVPVIPETQKLHALYIEKLSN